MATNQPGPKIEYAGPKQTVTMYLPAAVVEWLETLAVGHSAAHVGRDRLVEIFERETGVTVSRLTTAK